MSSADDFFAAAAELGRVIAERRAAERKAARDARNARRRARYASRPKPVRKPAPEIDYGDGEMPDECFCNATSAPPCGWCEHGGSTEEGTETS